MCDLDATDVLQADDCKTNGGLKVKGYYAKMSDIATFPAPAPAATAFGESVTVADPFVMAVGKYFRTIEGDLETLQLKSDSAGNLNNLSAANRYTFRQAGSNKALVGFLKNFKNKNMVFIIEDSNGTKRIMGQDGLPAKIESFTEDSGKTTADDKYIEFVAYSPGDLPYFYEAAIPLEIV